MGYRGKTDEQDRARSLRAQAWTLQEIADELGVHQGLDLESANAFWSELLAIPVDQFYKPYRAVPDPSIRKAKHVHGCPAVSYGCSRTHRNVMGLVHALLSSEALPG